MLEAPLSQEDRNPTSNASQWAPRLSASLPRSVRSPVPCVFLEPDLPWGGQGQDDQHREQGQGEALVSVPGLQDRQSTGQEKVTHWQEGGKAVGTTGSPAQPSPAVSARAMVPTSLSLHGARHGH